MIYVITHKKFSDSFINRNQYLILHVGMNNDDKSYYLRDDTGDNISGKNQHFCELTGLYWIWKNGCEKSDDITGLVHYRRFLTTEKEDFLYVYFHKKPSLLEYKDILKHVNNNEILLPKKIFTLDTVFNTYSRMHYAEDLRLVGEAIDELFPAYSRSFIKVMKSHHASYGNIIICKKKILDEYCNWLFPILFYVDQRIDYSKYNSLYQSRVIGFLAERTLDIWADQCKYRIVRYPVFNMEQPRMGIISLTIFRMKTLISLLLRHSIRQ